MEKVAREAYMCMLDSERRPVAVA